MHDLTLVPTSIGQIATYIKLVPNTVPVVLLHGVYFDHHLWNIQEHGLEDVTIIAIDMPMHGESKYIIKKKWTLEDCAIMLLEILDFFQIEKVIGIGHSWGSMTLLKAASMRPKSFLALGFCNMPYKAPSLLRRIAFRLQSMAIPFRNFYMQKAAQALFAKASLEHNPGLLVEFTNCFQKLTDSEIRQTNRAVIIQAENAETLIRDLKVPALALKGEEDYVEAPPVLPLTVVAGGHTSPLEAGMEVSMFIRKVIQLTEV